jgi:hypothetical protein
MGASLTGAGGVQTTTTTTTIIIIIIIIKYPCNRPWVVT